MNHKKKISMKRNVMVLIGILIVFMSCVFFAATPRIPSGRFRTTVASKVKFVNSFADNSSYDLFEYYVGNKKYQYIGEEHMAWVTKGEKYLSKYDTLNPGGKEEHCDIITEHPVFLPEEVTSYAYGTLKKLGVKINYLNLHTQFWERNMIEYNI
jgi:PDZ domain-containing secreted protein